MLLFFMKAKIYPFIYFSIVFCLYTALHDQRSMSSNFLVFNISGGILLRPVAFLLLIVVSIVLSSSSIDCQSFMSSQPLLISSVGLFREGFQSVSQNVLPTPKVFFLCWKLLVFLLLDALQKYKKPCFSHLMLTQISLTLLLDSCKEIH